jgi:hypothetical protein
MNVAADSRGHIAGFFGFLAHLQPGTITNVYRSNAAAQEFSSIRLNREPTHDQKQTVANLQLNHDLSDDLLLTAKVSYETREFYQSGDNDQAYTTDPFTGLCCIFRTTSNRRLFMLRWRKTILRDS